MTRVTPVEWWRARSLELRGARQSSRVLDAGGTLDASTLRDVAAALQLHGAVHVRRTGLSSVAQVVEVLPALGFGEAQQFHAGGRTSAKTQEKWVAPGLRRLDAYPADLHLLANNEVQYRHTSPRLVLFACLAPAPRGGRVLLHQASAVEAGLARRAPALLARMLAHGFAIESGFLDEAYASKAANTFQSWQERFETNDAALALSRAKARTDEVTDAWWGPEGTLMTRVVFSAKWRDERGDAWLRFPRVALDPPSAVNGFRRFPLGDGSELTAAEAALVREVLLETAEGVELGAGDLVLFDNLRFGHSREAFEGARDVVVGMAGECHDPRKNVSTVAPARQPVERLADGAAPQFYTLPPRLVRPEQRFTARVFDAGGALTDETLGLVARELSRHGAVHVQRTGLQVEHPGALPERVLRALGFGGDDAFPWGGLASGRTTRRALSPELRATDTYPPHLWLLPHNEVLYQRTMPARLLFFSSSAFPRGGRTFVHSAKLLERVLRDLGGAALLETLRRTGLLIEMGFVDEGHPARHLNFFRSWQERFATSDRREAEQRCRAATHQFDDCWWKDEGGGHATLMTRIRVPAFCDGHLLFPRVALDPPALQNGHRRYPRGDGVPFTDGEVDLLLHAFLETREGVEWAEGDLLLVDNLRYGHSREAFTGARTLGVAMGGVVDVGPPP
jgi:hypothetical protein